MKQAISVYFDTNVYRLAREKDEIEATRLILRKRGAQLVISSGNIFETLAISQGKSRREEAEAIVSLEPKYEEKPESWHHARELLLEIRRRRPNWIRSVSFQRSIKRFLTGHLTVWEMFKTGDYPSPEAYAHYRRDFERGVEQSNDFDKFLRTRMRTGDTFAFGRSLNDLVAVDLRDPEVYWRFESLSTWHAAIVVRSKVSRDYADWLDPFLKNGAFEDPSYERFWLHDASANNLPLNRLTGLVAFYQLKRKITHGNAADQQTGLQLGHGGDVLHDLQPRRPAQYHHVRRSQFHGRNEEHGHGSASFERPSGRHQRPHGRRRGALHRGQHRPRNLAGARHAQRPRDDQ